MRKGQTWKRLSFSLPKIYTRRSKTIAALLHFVCMPLVYHRKRHRASKIFYWLRSVFYREGRIKIRGKTYVSRWNGWIPWWKPWNLSPSGETGRSSPKKQAEHLALSRRLMFSLYFCFCGPIDRVKRMYRNKIYRVFCIKPVAKRKRVWYDMKLLNSGAVS